MKTIKEQVYTELSRVSNALSNAKRLELIDTLSQKNYSVEELSREVGMTIANTSQHLQVLKSAKLVDTARSGNFIIYSITDDSVLQLVSVIKELGFRKLTEIEALISDFKAGKRNLKSITMDDLLHKFKKEKVFLIDVRPADEYNAGHIPNAVSIPIDQLKKRVKELPGNKTIIAYCRGPLCIMALEATKILCKKKFLAIHLKDGYVEWKLNQLSQTY